MRTFWLTLALLAPAAGLPLVGSAADEKKDDKKPAMTWKRTQLDKAFRSEGATAFDVNKDGKVDILNGEVWYEAPDWKRHEIRSTYKMRPDVYKALAADAVPAAVVEKLGALKGRFFDWTEDFEAAVSRALTKEEFAAHKDKIRQSAINRDHAEGKQNVYSRSFACWGDDVNGDGWTDLIVVGFPGAPCHWFENPKNVEGPWKRHEIWHSACNETPQYVDLLGNGKRALLMGWLPRDGKGNDHRMSYFTPGKDPTKTWEEHPISGPAQGKGRWPGTFHFDHGLGIGDLDRDGKQDVLVAGGWWQQPAKLDGKTPWKFHPGRISDACADMYAMDVDGDGIADVLSSAAHLIGIWYHKQTKAGAFRTEALFPKLVSQTHAMVMADVNGDDVPDFITGKRWWAHGPTGDVNPNDPAKVFWFEAARGKDGALSFTPHEIDDDSGVGTQFYFGDVTGDRLPDVVVSNKKGTFLIEQVRAKR